MEPQIAVQDLLLTQVSASRKSGIKKQTPQSSARDSEDTDAETTRRGLRIQITFPQLLQAELYSQQQPDQDQSPNQINPNLPPELKPVHQETPKEDHHLILNLNLKPNPSPSAAPPENLATQVTQSRASPHPVS